MGRMAGNDQTSAMQRLIERLSRLPGVGRRSAQRMAFHLLKAPPEESLELAQALQALRANTRQCSACFNIAETDPCPICADTRRDGSTILVVEQPADVATFEATGMYRGLYHVLMGRLAPLDGVGPGELTLTQLARRASRPEVREVIIGTNPTLEGDGTALYLEKQLAACNVKLSRLARGLPSGASLDIASKAALADAIEGRRAMQ